MIRAKVESRVWLHSPPLTLKADFVLISPTVLDFNSRPRGGASGHTEISAPFVRRPHTETCLGQHGEGKDEGERSDEILKPSSVKFNFVLQYNEWSPNPASTPILKSCMFFPGIWLPAVFTGPPRHSHHAPMSGYFPLPDSGWASQLQVLQYFFTGMWFHPALFETDISASRRRA